MLKMGKKTDVENSENTPKPDNKVNVVAQELKFAKMLASNDVKIRNSVLKSLKKWLNTRSQSSYQFTNKDFLRLWKGLYYCMWMSDKPLVQEELTEDLGSLIHCFPDAKVGIQFYRNFLETMCLEWFGIDQWRIDKFMMLVRRVTRQTIFSLKNSEWDEELLKLFGDSLATTVFQTNKCPKGLIMHICDFYIEEIAKVSDGELIEERVYQLLEPFLLYYTKLNDHILLQHVEKTIFHQLLFQSELGQEYQEKFEIWKQANFPTSSIDDLEVKYKVRGNKSVNNDDLSDGQEDDEEERALDPRAGRVDVVLSEIKFDASKIAETMETFRYKSFATSKSRKGLARMALKFRNFLEDIFPLGISHVPQENEEIDSDIDLDLKAMELAEFEKKLAIGDVDSDGSDFDEDLDNRKHGKLKRKSKDASTKIKDKKQKLSKLHNERFLKESTDDFTQDNGQQDDEEEEVEKPSIICTETKIKKKKKAEIDEASEGQSRKIKIKKRKSLPVDVKLSSEKRSLSTEKPSKALKSHKNSSPSSSGSSQTFEVSDEWSEPLKEGETEYFVTPRKQKLKGLQQIESKVSKNEENSTSLVLNPFAKHTGVVKKQKESKSSSSSVTTTPRIQMSQPSTSGSSGKRVIIALNKNKAQSEHEYIKQVMSSPNLPFDSSKKPVKSLLKPNVIPSPINPFYQKKIGLKLSFNDTM
ncbi:CLUMA_CG004117, isoform A [Clunio marinus]|uniref:CLUMA_CG004117, isoform A n=1 Tax=Clunio marinus TaxID=568069 RepID=A0A1J1HQV2_9DIPT|nr:CLUMA_CG004117, isoform A [Clunio marinus]